MKHKLRVIITPDGDMRHLLDEENEDAYSIFGEKTAAQRSSHVELAADLPDEALQRLEQRGVNPHDPAHGPFAFWVWIPVCGEVYGPFPSRKAALDEEQMLLFEQGYPIYERRPP